MRLEGTRLEGTARMARLRREPGHRLAQVVPRPPDDHCPLPVGGTHCHKDTPTDVQPKLSAGLVLGLQEYDVLK